MRELRISVKRKTELAIAISKPELWITYAWKDNEEGDFSYLVQELEGVGVRARYDRIALVTGRRL